MNNPAGADGVAGLPYWAELEVALRERDKIRAELEAERAAKEALVERWKNFEPSGDGTTRWDDGYESGLVHCACELDACLTATRALQAQLDALPGCQCACHDHPQHGRLQDALEALTWHQQKVAELQDQLDALPPAVDRSDLRAIAARHFHSIMEAEVEWLGCEHHKDVAILFCCQWNRRPLCAECADLQRKVEDYAITCMREATQPPAVDRWQCPHCGLLGHNHLSSCEYEKFAALAGEATQPSVDPPVNRFAIDICDDCLELKGESCNNPDCIFCRRAMSEVRELLEILSIMPCDQPPVDQPLYRGHIDSDCEVARGVGWMCTCQTSEEKAEDRQRQAEIETEQDAGAADPPVDRQGAR